MKRLPIDDRGFPVPWFVAWIDGRPDFRVIDTPKLPKAVNNRLCWVCGGRLGVHMAFVIGPMCALNRIISEPPSHYECATFAARACPFLSNPRMRRNTKGLPEKHQKKAPGIHLDRNPGVVCVWVTRTFQVFRPHVGADGVLFALGPPEAVKWFARGRDATREEVIIAIEEGVPALRALENTAKAQHALDIAIEGVMKLIPGGV
jgi:hypothetical protein